MSLVTYDNSLFGTAVGGNVSFSFTVGASANTGVLLAVYSNNSVTSLPSTPVFGGASMTLVTANAGPSGTWGSLEIWYLLNASSGANTVTFNTGSDATTRYYAVYSYSNFKAIDTSGITQNTYSSSFVSNSLTGIGTNTLMWAVAGGNDTSGHNLNPTTGTTNTGATTSNVTMISAGDFGALGAPTSKSAQIGANPGAGNAIVALVSVLGPQSYSVSLASGAYTYTGKIVTFTKFRNYFINAARGVYTTTGKSISFSYTPSRWKKVSKPTNTSWTKVTKPTGLVTIQAPGQPIGLLLALTYSTTASVLSRIWTKTSKPISTTWTKIPKPPK